MDVKIIWKEKLKNKNFTKELVFTLIILIFFLVTLSKFLNFVQDRNGTVLDDPILNLFNPIDLTWLTFIIIYSSVCIAIYFLIKEPPNLISAIQSYCLMIFFRMIAMYLVPLLPPVKTIPLSDPFVQLFASEKFLTNDLFFSGHTATLFILFLTSENKKHKIFFISSTLIVAVSVLLQHIHYTIDVFAAFIFAYSSFKIITSIRKRNEKNLYFD